MAYAAPRIRERLAGDGDELPVVASGEQRQLQDAISLVVLHLGVRQGRAQGEGARTAHARSEEHTSELQSQSNLVCRLLLEKKKKNPVRTIPNHSARTSSSILIAYNTTRPSPSSTCSPSATSLLSS